MLRYASRLSLFVLLAACSSSSFSGGSTRTATKKTDSGNGPNGSGGPNGTNTGSSVDNNGSGTNPNSSVDGNGTGKNGSPGNNADAGSALGGSAGGNADGANASGGGVNAATLAAGGLLGASGNGAILSATGTLIACPKAPQSILILDFKSGWWAGDGGQFFQKIVDFLHQGCTDSVTIEYHHIITLGAEGGPLLPGVGGIQNQMLTVPGDQTTNGGTDFATAFKDATFRSYTQIWVLSGSAADPEDLQINDPFFVQVLQAANASKAQFFIGVGYGSISHGNAFLQTLGVPANFATQQAEGDILDPTSGVGIASVINASTFQKHVLFTNAITALPDDMQIAGKDAHGDNITVQAGMTIIASDNLGQGTIAVPSGSGGRKVVLDSDLPRYYAIWQAESPDALQLLKNIIVFLSN